MSFGPERSARSGYRSLRLLAITSVACAYGKQGMSRRRTLAAYWGPAYHRTSWPRSRSATANPVSGLKWPSAGIEANKIFMASLTIL
jgi:hypothetical protein